MAQARIVQVGTAYFMSFRAACRYYAPYGFCAADVQRKINEGEIYIGKPPLRPGTDERAVLIPGEGRYAIEYTEART